ncbi:LL-diaminopimelate aminotransferase DapL [Thermacetogenium phaeum DSM 12270]|jgi:LL-diaminopimelate aminotransferase|uniref:LL-diaminopimelate aminotransferase n=2 Tax=Thermacetogenium phaeum TaxID=85874 RepID=K4LF31_THEPS|nr:LL-diaminopimelate aminotransferase [Thermacetogenium phaeum]AFV11646.1 LL-diaminopimelate aminotransferase DapL [Thermacetogenium phaeum DSM 12270]KUK36140.1 MAG: LL-diaminopimelate aminotransferase [Thermacetogenium phaeum]MDN5365399.1 LL-diaminopimelate aminotransferase [Thermacetogenium sp.]
MKKVADRLAALPPYLFARIEQKIEKLQSRGIDVISLGIGDPDLPTPSHIVKALIDQAQKAENHRYPTSAGLLAFRTAVASWYRRRFGVELDPASEVVTLIGSKEGIAHISFCYLQEGDLALVPDPAYPVYGIGAALAGAEVYSLPLKGENNFLPDLSSVPVEVARKASLLFLNYPNNPTGATCDKEFFQDVVSFARHYDLIVCHDAAYSEITFDGYVAPSFLEVPGAKDVGIEFHSLSKTYNMTGWRIGWAAGNAELIKTLSSLKSNLDSGVFQAIQYAGIAALEGPQDCIEEMRRIYRERREIAVAGLKSLGWDFSLPKGTIYLWVPVPSGLTSTEFAEMVLEKSSVVVTPGIGYGKYGDGYFRISLTLATERLKEAFRRMKEAFGTLYH